MALETLKNFTTIDGFSLVNMERLKVQRPDCFKPDGSLRQQLFDRQIASQNFIRLDPALNTISFRIQKGPIKENAINGCQVDSLIAAAKHIIMGLNNAYPCQQNQDAIDCLQEALGHLTSRRVDRMNRGVEGTSNE